MRTGHDPSTLKRVPPPHAVRAELRELVRRAGRLRSLLRVSELVYRTEGRHKRERTGDD
jgi:hypothetical protein